MRILAIRGRNLASLARSFAVELASGELANVGLFAITGPVGAGKSTLLDALCLALFDRTPRLKGRGGTLIGDEGQDPGDWLRANDPRTLLRRNAVDGHAEVDFVGRDGVAYRSRWSVRRARRKVDGRLQDQELVLEDLRKGTIVASGRKVDVLAAIQQRLGLDFAQFCRSVLLAQGEFHAFLHAAAQERAKLLETLTGAQLYRRLSRAAHHKRAEHEKRVATLRALVEQCAVLEDEPRSRLERDLEQLTHQVAICDLGIAKAQQYVLWHQAAEQNRRAEDHATRKLNEAVATNDAAAPRRAELHARQRALAAVPRWEVVQQARAKAAAGQGELASSAKAQQLAEQQIAQAQQELDERARQHFGSSLVMPAIVRELPRWRPALERWQQNEARLREAERRVPVLRREAEQGELGLEAQRAARSQHEDLLARSAAAVATAEREASEADYDQVAAKRRVLTQQRAGIAAADASLQLWRRADDAAQKQRIRVAASERELEALHKQFSAADARLGYDATRLAGARDDLRAAEQRHGLTALRSQLVESEPCPLCGSLEHPATDAHDSPDLDAVRQACKEAESGHAQAQERRAQAAAARSRAEADCESQRAELVALEEAVTAERAKCQLACRDLSPQEAEAEAQVGAGAEAIAALALRLESLQRAWAEADRELGRLEKDAASRSERLRQARAARTQAEDALAKWREGLALAEHAARKAADALRAAVAQCEGQRHALDDLLAQLADACEGLPGGVAAIADLGEGRLERLAELHACGESLQRARAHAQAVGEAVRAQRERQGHAEQDLDLAERAFATALTVNEVREEDVAAAQRLGADALMEESTSLQALLEAVHAARTELQLRAKLRREHEGHDRPTLDAGDALAALRDAQKQREVVDQQRVQASGQIALDDAMRKRRAELAPELDGAEKEHDVWCALHELIGSSTGDSFAVFAQGLTLDLLLLEANRRLEELARRYRLEKSKGGELDFVVVDLDMGGTRRSLHTLSGGETFLVSLALALALATLAAPRSRVETLFLDEGFGTLDSQNLEIALGALDSLQATGCQVGVISHVDGIAERIGAVVCVEPEGSGQSRVVARSV